MEMPPATRMTEAVRSMLRRSLQAGYRELVQRLTRRLGSPDLAREALHETWLRLERPGSLQPVSNPDAYLYRAALNAATNMRVAENRRLNPVEIDAILEIPDEAPGADRIAEGQAELKRLDRALARLPARSRKVIYAWLLEDISYDDLAMRHGVTVRTIHSDIRRAIEHCADELGVETIFAFDRRRLSRK